MRRSVKFLIHCDLAVLRIGLETFFNGLPFTTEFIYMNLNSSGLLKKCATDLYDFIVVSPSEADEDYMLCLKLKLFMPQIPVIYISSYIPEKYELYLKELGVEIIMDKSFDVNDLERQINKLLCKKEVKV